MADVKLTPKRRAVLEAIREISAGTPRGDATHREIGRKLGAGSATVCRLCLAMEGSFIERDRWSKGRGAINFWRITPAGLAALGEGE